jgi:glucose/arabinose dehydrogenase
MMRSSQNLHPKNRQRARRAWRFCTILILTLVLFSLKGANSTLANPGAVTWPSIKLQLIAEDFDSPVGIVSANDGTSRLFVIENRGLIHIVQNGIRLEPPFLDISNQVSSCTECGLLGLAFPPDFAEQGYFFVNYTSNEDVAEPDTEDPNTSSDTVIARFRVTANPNLADAGSEEAILLINQPDSNHNGGQIVFGPDEYLYIGMGDGGGGGNTYDNAQEPTSLLGKLLRIDVGATGTYSIPDDNPYADPTDGYRDEIWAIGLRNPWRFSFDRTTGDLYIADVGQGEVEEINYLAAADASQGGQNFGWSILEGNLCYPPTGDQDCDRTGLTAPVTSYTHNNGNCSVTGGYVYQANRPVQADIYLYADFCTGRIWGLQRNGNAWVTEELDDRSFQISSFGEDELGNVYVADYSNGRIYQIFDQYFQRIPNVTKAIGSR